MPPSVNAANVKDEPNRPAQNTAESRRRRLRRWLWRKTPYFIVILLITVLTLSVFWHRIVIVIEGGHAGVLFRLWSGTQIDYVYPEG
ncbi:MAG: hypothetical protein PHE55_01325, partial [Methylococcaceae bacterium]|nr:hypothetical protein [Methylococcaceae bacterium]